MNRKIQRKRRYLKIKLFMICLILSSETGVLLGIINSEAKRFNSKDKQVIMELDKTEDLVTENNIISTENVLYKIEQNQENEAYEEDNEQKEKKYKTVLKEKLLVKYSIKNQSSYGNRNVNLAVAASIINGKNKGYILNPGEKFSWLEVVGDPNEEKGFKLAPIIKNKQHDMGYGGGICQVSSTLYSAAYAAGIIKRGHYYAQKHSLKSSYINSEIGDKEATVSYSAKVDFWFENTLKYPIRIKVKTNEGTVTVKIFLRKEKKIEV